MSALLFDDLIHPAEFSRMKAEFFAVVHLVDKMSSEPHHPLDCSLFLRRRIPPEKYQARHKYMSVFQQWDFCCPVRYPANGSVRDRLCVRERWL